MSGQEREGLRAEFEAAWKARMGNIPNHHWDVVEALCFEFWQAAQPTAVPVWRCLSCGKYSDNPSPCSSHSLSEPAAEPVEVQAAALHEKHMRRMADDAGIPVDELKRILGYQPAAPAVPEGWKLVPVEPTVKQMAAMGPAIRACYGFDGVNGDVTGVYAAMLAAAPQAPAAEQWLPIESAPKDHFARLYLVDGYCVQGFVDVAGQVQAQSELSPHYRKMRQKPTHWMPLPAAPAAREGGEG